MGPRWVVGHHWLNRGTHVVYPIENWPYSVCHFGITHIMYLFILWDNYMEVLLPIYPPVTDCGAHDMRNIPYQNHQPIGIQSQIYSSWFIQRFFSEKTVSELLRRGILRYNHYNVTRRYKTIARPSAFSDWPTFIYSRDGYFHYSPIYVREIFL